MGLEEERTEGVEKKVKKPRKKSTKGKKDEVNGKSIHEAEHFCKYGVIDHDKSSVKEIGDRGDNKRKKNKKKKKVENRLGTEDSGIGYGIREGDDNGKESDIHGQKNHDVNVIGIVERKKKRKNDKSEQSFEDVDGKSMSRESPNEFQNGTGVAAVGQGSDGIVVLKEHKGKTKEKSKRPENDNQQAEGVEAFGEGHELESFEGVVKRKKRKREKDNSVVSEAEVQCHDCDDPEGKRQPTFDEHIEPSKRTNVEAIAQCDVVRKDEKKRKKKSKKTKVDPGSGADSTMDLELGSHFNDESNGKKEKAKSVDNGSENPKPGNGKKKVSFSGKDEVFLLPEDNLVKGKQFSDETNGKKERDKLAKNGSKEPKLGKGKKKVKFSGRDKDFPLSEDNLVRGKRFSEEEDEMVKKAVFDYIKVHDLGEEEEGLKMVLNCKSHPNIRDCWKEIGAALPHRPRSAVYYRAQVLFRRDKKRKWTKEEIEALREHHKKHGNQWKDVAVELGKHRVHVKDTWRRIRHENLKKGRWSQGEYQSLYDLVNLDLRMKYSEEKKSKHGMLRDNVPWTAISDKMTTRAEPSCCFKWYYQLTSPMVMEGIWVDSDDYRLIDALYQLDANCSEDVDWDSLLDHRSGAICQKRWNEMVQHIGNNAKRSFADQVEVLAKRYCPELLEFKEVWDSKPYVP